MRGRNLSNLTGAAGESRLFNNMKNHLDRLNNIADTPGKNDKVDLLKEYLQDEEFRTLIKYMLDPYLTYGILDFPDYWSTDFPNPVGDAPFEDIQKLLDNLAERKLTGLAASHQAAIMASRGVGRDLMLRILNKDPKAGFGISTVNKAWPGLLPQFPYMRCSLPKASKMEEFPWDRGVFSQLKADGMFVNINKTLAGDITLMSRQGTLIPLTELGSLVKEIQDKIKPGTQTHGELLVWKGLSILPREIGNGMLNSVAQGGKLDEGYEIMCHVWDQIPLDQVKPKGKYKVAYSQRWSVIQEQLPTNSTVTHPLALIGTRIVYSRQEAYQHYQELLELGHEGTVFKSPDAIWQDGTSPFQVKLKLEVDCDLIVTAFRPGKGKNEKTFGAVVAQTANGDLEVGVSGFTDAQRAKIWKEKDQVLGSIMTVKANEIMKPSASSNVYSLFLPRFVEMRKDKVEADTLEQVINQFEAAKNGTKI